LRRDRVARRIGAGDAETRRRRFKAIAAVAERKLQMLDDSYTLNDLSVPPGNRLEALHGNRRGQWSIRINDQWRICFRFEDGDAFDVEIVDYH
jgi:proteic killer suppression protein